MVVGERDVVVGDFVLGGFDVDVGNLPSEFDFGLDDVPSEAMIMLFFDLLDSEVDDVVSCFDVVVGGFVVVVSRVVDEVEVLSTGNPAI